MWIHLLTIGLIDGAGGNPVPPEPTDTHDGFWRRKYREMFEWDKKKPTLEEVIELVQEEPQQAIAVVKEEIKESHPEIDLKQTYLGIEVQRVIARLIMRKLELKRAQEIEDHNIRVLLLT
jgi:hypothetical protein